MFTGLVEEIGSITAIERYEDSRRLCIAAVDVLGGVQSGDSISVDGVCLTATDLGDGYFWTDVMAESLARSTLGELKEGSRVNVERALAVGDRLGGHIVQGHVDTTTTLRTRTSSEHWEVLRFALPQQWARYVVEKGSIAINGVSLTVSTLGEDYWEVSLIPTTLAETTLGVLAEGARVNIEFDVLAKYVERLTMSGHMTEPGKSTD